MEGRGEENEFESKLGRGLFISFSLSDVAIHWGRGSPHQDMVWMASDELIHTWHHGRMERGEMPDLRADKESIRPVRISSLQ